MYYIEKGKNPVDSKDNKTSSYLNISSRTIVTGIVTSILVILLIFFLFRMYRNYKPIQKAGFRFY